MISIKNVTKLYQTKVALNDVSVEVRANSICGLFGPNGAGKTTLIKLICGILKSDSGTIILGSKRISYLPEEFSLLEEEKVIDSMVEMLLIKMISKKLWDKEISYWSEKVGISEFLDRRVKTLSKGQKRKVMFAISMFGAPEIIILDEPFVGIDIEALDCLREILFECKNQGKTILISSHILDYADELCDDFILLKKGQVLRYGVLREVKKEFREGDEWKVILKKGDLENKEELVKKLAELKLNVSEIGETEPRFREIYKSFMTG